MALLLLSLLLLALTGLSLGATYCVMFKQGLSDQVLMRTPGYACRAGAECSPICPNGACCQPNTIKNHCDYAVNS
ncbi:hypothetical protein CRG98_026284 [Punica granatum]|uniref:X8 domain-containing protein n=1 Tax=Punica granatum TaxID=22663 RepID=A0A2I0JAR7_PUNGR|nr:hypothetical protein CRG98_026284 [Punica granatum]